MCWVSIDIETDGPIPSKYSINALDNAIGNAEVFLEIQNKFKIKGMDRL